MATRSKRVTPVRVGPPRTAPITPEEYAQAVTAIATMISLWWDANGREVGSLETQTPDSAEPGDL
jgi:hypothetical protein